MPFGGYRGVNMKFSARLSVPQPWCADSSQTHKKKNSPTK